MPRLQASAMLSVMGPLRFALLATTRYGMGEFQG
jgi:hypothetical protein